MRDAVVRVARVCARGRQVSQKRRMVREMQEDLKRRTGRDVTEKLRDLKTPDEGEVRALSTLFNDALARRFKPGERSFYRIFKAMDLDGSHRISFNELRNMTRGPLRTRLAQLAHSAHGTTV